MVAAVCVLLQGRQRISRSPINDSQQTSSSSRLLILVVLLCSPLGQALGQVQTIWAAALAGDTVALQAAIDSGTDPNAWRSDGYAAIHLAAKQGQLASVKVLLANGASIEERDRKHAHTAVHKAAWASRLEVLVFLLAAGADPNPRDTDGDMIPLHWATDRRIAKLLLTAGANPDAADIYGETPLHTAASRKHAGVVAALLAGGANPNLKNDDGQTPLHIAAAWSDQAIVSQFREYLFIEPFASFGQAAEFLIRCVPSGTHGLVKLEKRKVELQRSSDLIDWHTIMVKDNLQSITHFKDSASPQKKPRSFYRARYSP